MSDGARRARVLVVDDSRFHRELASSALQGSARVEVCVNGIAALEALSREPADLVITDLTMPGLSGLDLLERIQREHPGTDVVILTANASVDSAVAALRTGATDYIQKPVRADDLILVVERTLGRRALVQENVRLRDERAILEACKSLTPCLEPGDVFGVGLDLVLRAVGRSKGLGLYHRSALPTSDGLTCRGFSEDEEGQLRALLAEEKTVDLSGITLEGEGAQSWTQGPLFEALRRSGIDVSELLVLPVRGGDAELGILVVVDEGRAFDAAELGRADLVRGHAAVSLRNAERYRRARDRAFTDDVTEIYNARYLLEAMEREIRRARRYEGTLSVLFLDLDRFKLVNDHHGHLIGSRVLRQLSRLLTDCVRQVDTLARYGGDEFTIILVDSPEAPALDVAERIRRTVADHAFEGGASEALRLTCSVGVASFPVHGESREALLDAADKAMYRAKSEGRNRVCSASELG